MGTYQPFLMPKLGQVVGTAPLQKLSDTSRPRSIGPLEPHAGGYIFYCRQLLVEGVIISKSSYFFLG